MEKELGKPVNFNEVQDKLKKYLSQVFGMELVA